jgi:hypothetical protein
LKKAVHYIITSLTVFIFGYLFLHSNDALAISQPVKKESSKEVSYNFSQGKIDFNQEGTQKESISLKTSQNSSSNEIVRKQIPSFLIPNSFLQLELFNKNSFEVFFVKKNLLNLFLNTSRIIFPFHYFW